MKKISIFLTVLLLVFEICTPLMAQVTVLRGNYSTSGSGNAPQGTRRYINTKYIISSAEMITSEFFGQVTSVGWRWNVPRPPASTAPIAQNIGTIGNLRVYLKDTVTGATRLGSSLIDTNGVGYTKVIDGTISIPAGLAEINIDVPVGGPGTSSYTPAPRKAVLVIFVYKTTSVALATPVSSPNICGINSTVNSVSIFRSNLDSPVNGQNGILSSFRPETRFGRDILPDDIGVSATNLNNGRIFSLGKCIDFTATVKNYGTNSQSNVPVYYTVDNTLPAIGSVMAVGPIAKNGTENVSFTGGLCALTVGQHTIEVYTDAPSPVNNRPVFITTIDISAKITSFPYTENFSLATGWTKSKEGLWSIALCGNPDGLVFDNAALCDFYRTSSGSVTLRSPVMDFTGISNPVLNFYISHQPYETRNDRIQVMVSVDEGQTFNPATTIYNKTWSTDPSLATLTPSTSSFTPFTRSHWRLETVDLSNVGNISNVVIGFVGTSAYGNNVWIDNVVVTQPNSLCTSTILPAPGIYNCNEKVSLEFTATPAPSLYENQSTTTKSQKESGQIVDSVNSNILTSGTDVIINSLEQVDNPNGGTVFVSQYTNNNPGQNIAPNTTATAPDASIYTPENVYHDFWFTVSYDGNDYQGYATYNISIDITDAGFTIPGALYIVKRTDNTSLWECQNTTLAGNILTVTGLTGFSDFGLAGQEVLPVELTSFVSSINGRNVELNWVTSSEINNSGFDIERSDVRGQTSNVWTKIGNVTGNGTTATGHSYTYTDRNVASGNYSYRLKQIDFNGNFEYFNLSNEVNVGIPVKYDLSQNYPNPFNPTTSINYEIPFDGKVSLKIFDMSGKEVATLVNEVKTAGYYSFNFNASNLSSGAYFYRINAGEFSATKRMILLK